MLNPSSANQKPDFDSLWNYDKPAETEAKFRQLLPMAEESGDPAYLAELKTQIARTLGLQQKFDQAHTLLDSVEVILKDAGERPRVRYLLERGRVFNSSGQKDKAVSLFSQAWEQASQSGLDFYAVDASHMLAIATPPEQHMGWNLKALSLAEKSSEPKARNWLGSLYNNIGWDYFSQEKYDSALTMFEKALTFRQEQKKPDQIRIAKWCLAKTLRMLGKVDSALTLQQELEKEWKESGEEQDGYVFEEMAECLLALKKDQEAAKYFALAYQYLSKDPWLAQDEPQRLQRLKELGKVK
jgi:tetratricopeptide (TPR) repeat protein